MNAAAETVEAVSIRFPQGPAVLGHLGDLQTVALIPFAVILGTISTWRALAAQIRGVAHAASVAASVDC
jgi:hypothetical protein